jgi:predicted DNA-binding transcriptional regulator YafY/transposase-like protein
MKRDRTARLLRLQLLLWQHPEGLELKNMALFCAINVRTVYRDLHTLEVELGVPIWQEGKRRGIMEGYFLPPINFTRAEAMIVFFSARLWYNHVHLYNPDLVSTIMQLGSIVSQPLRRQIQDTIDHIEKLPQNERKFNNFTKLTHAWLSQHPVTIHYKELADEEAVEYTIDPYFIEPNITRHYSYIIGFCHSSQTIRSFRVDCIVDEVKVDDSVTFKTPEDFNVNDYHSFGWGNCDSKKTETIKLRFSPRVNKSVFETVWHPSQKIDVQSDGFRIMTLDVENNADFLAWVVARGCEVEVLEPEEMRNQMIEQVKDLTELYFGHQREEFEQSTAIKLSNQTSKERFGEKRRLVKAEKIRVIRHEVLDKGNSIRSVAAQMGVSRNTAAKYIKQIQSAKATRKFKAKVVLDKILPRLSELLELADNKDRAKQLSGSQIHRKLVQEGYQVGVTTVREYLRKKKLEGKK